MHSVWSLKESREEYVVVERPRKRILVDGEDLVAATFGSHLIGVPEYGDDGIGYVITWTSDITVS